MLEVTNRDSILEPCGAGCDAALLGNLVERLHGAPVSVGLFDSDLVPPPLASDRWWRMRTAAGDTLNVCLDGIIFLGTPLTYFLNFLRFAAWVADYDGLGEPLELVLGFDHSSEEVAVRAYRIEVDGRFLGTAYVAGCAVAGNPLPSDGRPHPSILSIEASLELRMPIGLLGPSVLPPCAYFDELEMVAGERRVVMAVRRYLPELELELLTEETMQHDDTLPLTLCLGAIGLTVEEASALRPGARVHVALPESIEISLELRGVPIAFGIGTVEDGALQFSVLEHAESLHPRKLSSANAD